MTSPTDAEQGTKVPDELTTDGQWLVGDIAYLDFASILTPPPPHGGLIDLGVVRQTNSGPKICFSAASVADTMKISAQELRAANMAKHLALSSWQVPPAPGDTEAMRFRITYGGLFFEITIGISGEPMSRA